MLQPGTSPDHGVSTQKKTNDPTDPLLAIFLVKEVQVLHAAKIYCYPRSSLTPERSLFLVLFVNDFLLIGNISEDDQRTLGLAIFPGYLPEKRHLLQNLKVSSSLQEHQMCK